MLLHGDCLDIMPTLADKSIDAVICDIPSGRTACAWDIVIPFEAMWTQLKRLIKPRGAIVLLGCTQPFTSRIVCSNIAWFRDEWIWDKETGGSPMVAKMGPMRTHEPVLVFAESGHTYNPIEVPADPRNIRTVVRKPFDGPLSGSSNRFISRREMRYPKSIIRINGMTNETHRTKRLHTTQKPLPLMEYLIRTYTNEGDTILDFAAGSGTTHVAALNTGRQCVSIEKDDHYYRDVLCPRIATVEAQLRCL